MNGEAAGGASLNVRAVGAGALWGLALMLMGAIAQGLFAHGTPLSGTLEVVLPMAWRVLGAALAGFLAARRAEGAGWLHGLLAGMLLALALGVVTGVIMELPAIAVLAKWAGLGAGAGLVGGVAGVNLGRS